MLTTARLDQRNSYLIIYSLFELPLWRIKILCAISFFNFAIPSRYNLFAYVIIMFFPNVVSLKFSWVLASI